ncbi:TRAP transporter substrate-binding protein DctP [Arthrobacter sp. I2-34]|uniref:TRAP transporter substrate-binding protein DctP n=1 Tax=Arthrobacter hankyongi TaxID=2904801 RepID=A0ABS9L416_9MICC|nr:TRAP transporter substrate-binding protein DctP [Arthrobacter hankyongi]MCG2621303.1 TRAP transporter substrate-binding protein DctP [Arthrobacter hankyongi]
MKKGSSQARYRRAGVAALLGAAMVSLSACAGGAGAGNASTGESVPVGASKEEYIAALGDMEPVNLTVQLTSGPGSAYSAAPEAYTKALEEWSGGKLKFEILYSGSRVPVNEMDRALAEGLVDMGQHVPAFTPDEFPINSFASDLLYLHEPTPVVGSLEMAAAWMEFGITQNAIRDELTEAGVQPLIPLMPTGSAALMCAEEPGTSLASLKGKQVRNSSAAHGSQLEAIGANPVNVPTAEVYQAMQRGVVDCAASSLAVADTQGLAEVTKHWTLDPQVQFSGTPVGFGLSLAVWNELPLAARQLMWDRLDVYVENHVKSTMFGTYEAALSEARKHNVEFHEWDADTREALRGYFDDFLAQAPGKAPAGIDGQALVGAAVDGHAAWKEIITGELGYGDEVPWSEFDTWLAGNELDLQPFVDRMVKDVLEPHRPAA